MACTLNGFKTGVTYGFRFLCWISSLLHYKLVFVFMQLLIPMFSGLRFRQESMFYTQMCRRLTCEAAFSSSRNQQKYWAESERNISVSCVTHALKPEGLSCMQWSNTRVKVLKNKLFCLKFCISRNPVLYIQKSGWRLVSSFISTTRVCELYYWIWNTRCGRKNKYMLWQKNI